MVTRTVVRILPEEKSVAAVEESSRADGIKERDDYSNDEHDICDTIQLCSFQGCQRKVTAGGICDGHSYNDLFYGCKPSDGTSDEEKEEASFGHNHTDCKKRPSLNNDDAGDTKKTERRKIAQISIDLTDVPPQPPIPKSRNRGGNSKYQGVSFHKAFNKWEARIFVNGKQRCIGYYDDEEEAAIDYARAVWKYRGETQKHKQMIDLTDVPAQQPILKSSKGGSSKYKGVSFDKPRNKWRAQIMLNGKPSCIGYYDNEEDAAVDYARTVWKCRGETIENHKLKIDLTDVPTQQPILKSNGNDSSSKYQGVSFHKNTDKWMAQIFINGTNYAIGYYDIEEEAAADYARAVFKYKAETRKKKRQKKHKRAIDFTDVPKQLPILKSNGKSGHSKYQGVYFQKGKWMAQISINGTAHFIGYYDNEEEAAIDYARAMKKYRGETKEHKRAIDLTDVPKQLPILKSSGKSGSSKYQGVTLCKGKWHAQIAIKGKSHFIGLYDNEEEAAVDYARAMKKYRGETKRAIDLTDIPSQPPILKSNGRSGHSKYQGVTLHKGKWHAQIAIKGKSHFIGLYDNEEEAAVDYARALFKYRVDDKVDRSKKRRTKLLDLTDVPTQPPILNCHSRGGSSKYQGVSFDKRSNKWKAQILINGKRHSIGLYDDEEGAAIDYARALQKYRSENIQAGNLTAERDLRKSCQTESQHRTASEEVCSEQKEESDTNPTPLLSVSKRKLELESSLELVPGYLRMADWYRERELVGTLELVNKDGRIGIYLPEERKARIARFHAKRSARVFKRRVSYGVRKTFADSRPRHKGRFVPKSVEGEDSLKTIFNLK